MTTLEFRITIHADSAKVWNALWAIENYKSWSDTFCEGSYYKTEQFVEGSKIHFLSPGGQGIFSIIDKLEINKYLAFKHLGEIKDFEEQLSGAGSEMWSNAMETYSLEVSGNETILTVRVDIIEAYADYMRKTFPLALQKIKLISEQ